MHVCCMFSFSRKVVWLSTNHDHSALLSSGCCYFERYTIIYSLNKNDQPYLYSGRPGRPSILRMDHGTENSFIGAIQYSMREDGQDPFSGERSIRYGTSPANIVCYEFIDRKLTFFIFRGLSQEAYNWMVDRSI